jgi:hypothetical protein
MSDVRATIGPHRMRARPKLWVMFPTTSAQPYGGLVD